VRVYTIIESGFEIVEKRFRKRWEEALKDVEADIKFVLELAGVVGREGNRS